MSKADSTDLTGKVFTRLTVEAKSGGGTRADPTTWTCRCTCGNQTTATRSQLINGRKKSCGCLHREQVRSGLANKSHGLSTSQQGAYLAWKRMWARCTAPSLLKEKPEYAARRPPEAWRYFPTFFAELGPHPGPGYSLDRIDNDKPYGPGNCRWATNNQQAQNTRTNRRVVLNGSVVALAEAARRVGIPYETLRDRMGPQGMSFEEAVRK